jgi:hypothetical protein
VSGSGTDNSSGHDAAASAFERLRRLLSGPEQDALGAAVDRLDDLEREQGRSAEKLPELLEEAQAAQPKKLAKALAAPVGAALATAVKQQSQTIVDALFPVIGPAIRRAITEAMRSLTADLNAALESSLTPRGLRWRFEAWRAGVPYTQIVLKHTLRYKVDHLFLIEADSGLVIHRDSAPDLPDLDSDAIAGMLTAIGEFVQDSVGGAAGSTLDSANVGEHLLWVLHGPRANLAAFIRGVPPTLLREVLERKLEAVHQRWADPTAGLSAGAADPAAALEQDFDLAAIDRSAREGGGEPPAAAAKSSRRPLLIALGVVTLLLLVWGWRSWSWSRQVEAVRVALSAWPGLHLDAVDDRGRGRLAVRGLVDPLADPPRDAVAKLLPDGSTVDWQLRGFLSNDPEILVARARRMLAPPDTVTLTAADGTLTARGVAMPTWIAAFRSATGTVPGVIAVDADGLHPDWVADLAQRFAKTPELRFAMAGDRLVASGHAPAAELARLDAELDLLAVPKAVRDLSAVSADEQLALAALTKEIEPLGIDYAAGAADNAAAAAALDELARKLRGAQPLARALGKQLVVRTYGQTDEAGDEALNRDLRQRRAEHLARELSRRLPGIAVAPATDLAADDPRVTLRQRAAHAFPALTPEGSSP